MEAEKSTLRSKWTNAEELTLVQAVYDREQTLFGSMSGSGAVKMTTMKMRAWEEIAEQLNSQFFLEKRLWKDCRKKFHNIKARAKERSDAMKKTGGGALKQLSPSEQLIMEFIGSRASVVGITMSVETGSSTGGTLTEACQIESSMKDSTSLEDTMPTREVTTATATATATTSAVPKMVKRRELGQKRKYQELATSTLDIDQSRMRMEMSLMELKRTEIERNIQLMDRTEEKLLIEIRQLKEKESFYAVKKEYFSLKIRGMVEM